METTTAATMVADARARVRGLTPAALEAHLLAGECRLVDIREPEELDEQGLIAGAHHVPRGLLEFWADPTRPLHRPELDPQPDHDPVQRSRRSVGPCSRDADGARVRATSPTSRAASRPGRRRGCPSSA